MIWQMFSPEGVEALEIMFKQPSVISIRIQLREPLEVSDRVVQVVKLDKSHYQELTTPDLREILRRVGLDKEE